MSFYAVAAHEFGHSLGLSHSSVQGAIMYPYYQTLSGDVALSGDDVVGIQAIYGNIEHRLDREDDVITEQNSKKQVPRTKGGSRTLR